MPVRTRLIAIVVHLLPALAAAEVLGPSTCTLTPAADAQRRLGKP